MALNRTRVVRFFSQGEQPKKNKKYKPHRQQKKHHILYQGWVTTLQIMSGLGVGVSNSRRKSLRICKIGGFSLKGLNGISWSRSRFPAC